MQHIEAVRRRDSSLSLLGSYALSNNCDFLSLWYTCSLFGVFNFLIKKKIIMRKLDYLLSLL